MTNNVKGLNRYTAGVPINIEYTKLDSDSGNRIISATSVFDDDFEEGTTDGPCPFTEDSLRARYS